MTAIQDILKRVETLCNEMKTQDRLLAAVIVFIMPAIFWIQFIQPWLHNLEEKSLRKYRSLSGPVEKLRQEEEAAERDRQAVQAGRQDEEAFQQLTLGTDRIMQLLFRLEERCQSQKLTVQFQRKNCRMDRLKWVPWRATDQDPASDPRFQYARLPVEVELTGDSPGMLSFLHVLCGALAEGNWGVRRLSLQRSNDYQLQTSLQLETVNEVRWP